MAPQGDRTLVELLTEEQNIMKSPHRLSLQDYPPRRSSERNVRVSPARYSSASMIQLCPHSPESPWVQTSTLRLPSSPTLVYQCIASLHRQDGSVFSIAVLQGNILTGTESKHIRVWRQPDFVEQGYLKASSGDVRVILAHGNLLFTTHGDNRIRQWRVMSNGTEIFRTKKTSGLPRAKAFQFFHRRKDQHQSCISCLAYYHAEGLLYSGSWDKTVKIWRLSDGRCVDSFLAHDDAINAIVVNQEDGFVFTCSSDGSVKIWRKVYGENSHTLTSTLKFQHSPVNALALSASTDSCYLYSASSDGLINFWEKEKVSGRYNHGGFLQGHQYGVLCLETIENMIISGSEDATIRIWRRDEEVSFHECLAVMHGHNGPVRCLATCMEKEKIGIGFLIFSASVDGMFKVWRITVIPEENNAEEDVSVTSKKKKLPKLDLNGKSVEYELSPVLSPSWVKKKLQDKHRF